MPRHAGLLPVSLLAVLFAALSGTAASDDRFDQKPEKRRKFDSIQYFAQDGRTVSFGGDALVWKGEGDCSQNESMEPIISVQGDGVTVRNALIVESPDGIHVSGKDVVIENIVFPKICEDAITANGADNLIIRNCDFRGARDKAIQLNAGRNIVIEDCVFEDCSKPVRVKSGVTVTVRNNVCRDATFFVLADGPGADVRVENNRVEGSEYFVKADDRAVVRIANNRLKLIDKPNASENGGGVIEE